MPLFGHKNDNVTGNSPNLLRKNNPSHGTTGVDGTAHTGHHGHTGPGPVIGAAAGGAAGHHEGHTGTGALLGGVAGHHHAHTHPDVVPSGVHDSANVTAPGATTTAGGATIPAAHAAGTGMNHGGTAGAGEKELIGKIEHAAGTILCSSTLKAKGIEKEREAQALKVQAAEIGAAERLEQEANSRRERAVAHGAHPHQLHAQGLNQGTGVASGGNMAGVGAGGPHNAAHTGGMGTHNGAPPPAQDTYGTATGYPAGANDTYARGAPNAGVASAGNNALR